MARPIEQQLNELNRKRARLEKLQKQQLNGERFVVGDVMIAAAKRDPIIREMLLREIDSQPMRQMDRSRIEPFAEMLRKLSS